MRGGPCGRERWGGERWVMREGGWKRRLRLGFVVVWQDPLVNKPDCRRGGLHLTLRKVAGGCLEYSRERSELRGRIPAFGQGSASPLMGGLLLEPQRGKAVSRGKLQEAWELLTWLLLLL